MHMILNWEYFIMDILNLCLTICFFPCLFSETILCKCSLRGKKTIIKKLYISQYVSYNFKYTFLIVCELSKLCIKKFPRQILLIPLISMIQFSIILRLFLSIVKVSYINNKWEKGIRISTNITTFVRCYFTK